MTLDRIDIAILLAALFAGAGLLVLAWRWRERKAGLRLTALEAQLEAVRADPLDAMLAFLGAAQEALKQQSDALYTTITGLELTIARKRKRLSDLEKRPDRKDSEVTFQQEALALLNRRLIEYQAALRRMQQQQARTALIHRRIEQGALDPHRAGDHVVAADTLVEGLKTMTRARLRDVLDPEAKALAEERGRPATLTEWRLKRAEDLRTGPNVKRRLAK
jgi:chromosome segregation ATPase